MAISLMASRFSDSEYTQKVFLVHVPVTDEVTDLIKSHYWAHVARYLKPMNMIRAIRDDNKWYAEFLVLDADTNWAKVALIKELPLVVFDESIHVAGVPNFYVNWGGNHHKFQVRRHSDDQLMKSGFINEDEAKEWIKQHNKTLAHDATKVAALQAERAE